MSISEHEKNMDGVMRREALKAAIELDRLCLLSESKCRTPLTEDELDDIGVLEPIKTAIAVAMEEAEESLRTDLARVTDERDAAIARANDAELVAWALMSGRLLRNEKTRYDKVIDHIITIREFDRWTFDGSDICDDDEFWLTDEAREILRASREAENG